MTNTITASHFYDYVQCPYRVYLDIFADEKEKVEISEFMLKKMEDGVFHEKDVIKDEDFLEIEALTLEEGFKETVKAMKNGDELIYQGVLLNDDFIGKPDLLIKKEGKSKFGNYFYVPADIKSGKRLKDEYIMQVMFYCELLNFIQDNFPKKGIVINIEKEELEFNTVEYKEQYEQMLTAIKQIVNGKKEEPVYCSDCNECVWQELCFKELEQKQDVSLLYRLGRSVKNKLIPLGINNLTDLRKSDTAKLLEVKGIGEKSVKKWKLMAEAIQEKKMFVIEKPSLQNKKVEIFFDIEGEPELDIDYLYGCLIRIDGKEEFKYFWAEKPSDEGKMWKLFCEFIDSCNDDLAIYHYASYEKTALKKMKERYGCTEKTFDKIINNLVDLFPVVTNSVVLPVYSYSLKPIAKWLDFKWKDSKAGGAQSMFWYSRYLDGETDFKQTIIDYNKDDVIATRILKDWLINL